MHTQYNMDQLTLDMTTSCTLLKKIIQFSLSRKLAESLELRELYLFGRSREYRLSAKLKLVLFAYTWSVFSSCKIKQIAEEN